MSTHILGKNIILKKLFQLIASVVVADESSESF